MVINGEITHWLGVPSKGRSGNVLETEATLGHPATWYVAEDDAEDYILAGARSVRTTATGSLVDNRNAIMDDAAERGLPCITCDDDPIRFKLANDDKTARQSTYDETAALILKRLYMTPFCMAGVAPTDNPFYFHPQRRVGTAHFCDGFFQAFKPEGVPRNLPEMRLKEDYELTCQHINMYGGVVRCNDILVEFRQRTNAGGCVSYRTAELEEEMARLLIEKWPGVFRLNPKRENGKTQVLMRWNRPLVDLPDGLFEEFV